MSDYDHCSRIVATVCIRRDLGRAVRPEAEQVDGKTFRFRYAWHMDGGDPYPGEIAWMPDDPAYPRDAPTWQASGDLQICAALSHPPAEEREDV